jgi:hypothetical protein
MYVPDDPDHLTELTELPAAETGDVIAFDRDRAYWFEGAAAATPPELHALQQAASSYRAVAFRWSVFAILVTLMIADELGVVVVPILLVVIRPTVSAALAATAAIAIERVLLALHTVAWADIVAGSVGFTS